MTARIDCKDCDSENDMGRELIYFCPLHKSAGELLFAAKEGAECLRLWLSLNECDCEARHVCGRPALESRLAAIERIVVRAGRTWPQMLEDERNEALAKMQHE